MSRSLLILAPNLPREAAAELRRLAAEREGRPVSIASLTGHTEGQDLPHDVVAIGGDKPDLERDVRGTFKRYKSLEEFRQAMQAVKAPSKPAEAPSQSVEVPGSETKMPESDKFETMDRVQLIRYGAEHFPRKRQWATLDSEKLKAALRELEEAAH